MHKLAYLFLALSWTVLVTVLSIANVGSLGSSIKIPQKDKIVHFVFYFLFYVLWYGFIKYKGTSLKIKLIVMIVAIGYGILMEVIQAFAGTHRSSDFLDVFANSMGAFSGLIFTTFFLANKK